MSFVYYVPGLNRSPSPQEFEKIGIDHAFETPERYSVPASGPDGGSGMVVSPKDGDVGYYPDRQEWRKAEGFDYWVGMPKDWDPDPSELIRRTVLDGLDVELEDGKLWRIPRSREYSGVEDAIRAFVTLPHRLDMDDEGEIVVGPVLKRWEFLVSIADDFYDYYWSLGNEAADERFDYRGFMLSACDVIGANYRIRRRECFMLGLISEQSAGRVLRALVDMDSLNVLLKKKEARDSLNSSDGLADSTEEDTSQLSPTP